MRILLDACVPRDLRRSLVGHDISIPREMGWNKLPDGLLLDAMSGVFDVLVTVDRSMQFQQRLRDRTFAVILLRAKSNRLIDLLPLVPALLRALDEVKRGSLREIRA